MGNLQFPYIKLNGIYELSLTFTAGMYGEKVRPRPKASLSKFYDSGLIYPH